MTDRFVQQDSRPSRAQHYDHLSRRGLDSIEIDNGLARGTQRKLLPALVFKEVIPFNTAAATVYADLAIFAVLGDNRHIQPAKWLHIGGNLPIAVGDHHQLALGG